MDAYEKGEGTEMEMTRVSCAYRLPGSGKYLVLVYSFCLPTLSLLRAFKGQGKIT